jgi:hypothetical protein
MNDKRTQQRGGAEGTNQPDRVSSERPIEPRDQHTKAFVRGLVERGEAAKAGADGSLPPHATHEIIGETEEGLPIVVRRRYSGG